jgi:branched-subunit amino acid aminotransferase/4-amino-4-deoxychorismate lyase
VTALIETVRVRDGRAPLWYLHLARLAGSCKSLGIPLPPELPTPEGGADRVHRLEVSRRGLETTERALPEVSSGLRLALSRVTHRPYPHKTTDRARFDLALRDARDQGADDALMLTEQGWVAEAAVWAVFWWEGDRVCAPPLSLGVLPSVSRARVAELAGGVTERRVRPEQISGAGVFVGNAVRGLIEVASLAGVEQAPSRGFRRLSERFWP